MEPDDKDSVDLWPPFYELIISNISFLEGILMVKFCLL